MQKFGLVLHLVDFPSSVTITGNTVQDIGMKLTEVCTLDGSGEYFSYEPFKNSDSQAWYESWAEDILVERDTQMVAHDSTTATVQSHNLFLIETEDKLVTFSSNTFTNVVTSGSLIEISQSGFAALTTPKGVSFNNN
mmetsp:Transcript_41550/g.63416  ORF Transcript_41550/g.63416 Transcript_41550/m.63416 type:complete len:137 (-) Transcript_41550:394-804(-)